MRRKTLGMKKTLGMWLADLKEQKENLKPIRNLERKNLENQ